MPYAVAKRQLTAFGLAVRRSDVESTAPAGTVIAVEPTGVVLPHSTVTVSVATRPPGEPGGHHKPPGKAKGHDEKAGEHD